MSWENKMIIWKCHALLAWDNWSLCKSFKKWHRYPLRLARFPSFFVVLFRFWYAFAFFSSLSKGVWLWNFHGGRSVEWMLMSTPVLACHFAVVAVFLSELFSTFSLSLSRFSHLSQRTAPMIYGNCVLISTMYISYPMDKRETVDSVRQLRKTSVRWVLNPWLP